MTGTGQPDGLAHNVVQLPGGFDITGQDQPWKMKWATQARPASHHFIFKGPVGALAHAVGTSLKPSAWKQDQQTA